MSSSACAICPLFCQSSELPCGQSEQVSRRPARKAGEVAAATGCLASSNTSPTQVFDAKDANAKKIGKVTAPGRKGEEEPTATITASTVPGCNVSTCSNSPSPKGTPVKEISKETNEVVETNEVPQPRGDVGAGLPAFFAEILTELAKYERELGGVKNFRGCWPQIEKKVTASEFRDSYTDFEYIFLTILGFAQLHMNCEEIVGKNNGKPFQQNLGVQLLEQRCGMTMHGDRAGANHLLRTAPASVVEAYALAKMNVASMRRFFKEAFDRSADPCLEGRVSRLMEYLEARRQEADVSLAHAPPWDDVSLRPLAKGVTAQEVVGEHLRVFVNECTWKWAGEKGLDYASAKEARAKDEKAQRDFARLFNAPAFEVAMLARGVATDAVARQWEVNTDGQTWTPYGDEQNEVLERTRLLRKRSCEVRIGTWAYEIDLAKMVQRNRKTKKERPIRCTDAPAKRREGRLDLSELKTAIEYFVGLHTLPASPDEASPHTPLELTPEGTKRSEDLLKATTPPETFVPQTPSPKSSKE
mmetsp:Transcript_50305/g.79676  ORF Transcript_50305/g.79676 Transcript_50305/m.79676 type:complete len:529 (-) Transcript_50305:177-1763(-)